MRPTRTPYLIAAIAAALAFGLALRAGLIESRPLSSALRACAVLHANLAGRIPALGLAESWLVRTARADDVLKFRPVPPESASRFESMRVLKHKTPQGGAAAAPETPETPETPEAPATPEAGSPESGDQDLSGKSGSIMRIGSDIHVGPNEVIKGDVSTVGGNVLVEGHVEGDVVAMRGEVRLKSTARVDGDVVFIGGTLIEEQGAFVGGQRVTAMGGRNLHEWRTRPERHRREGGGVSAALVWLLVLLAMAWAFAQLAPGRTKMAVETARRQTALSFGIGALVVALVIPSIVALALAVALLCITIIGIPLALAALLGYFLFLALLGILGYVVGAAFVGGAASRRFSHPTVLAVGAPPPEPSIVGQAAAGVMVLAGAILVGQILRWAGAGSAFHGLGTLVLVLAIIASSFAGLALAKAARRVELHFLRVADVGDVVRRAGAV